MANLSGFDATKHEDLDSLEPIPAGWYTVVIVKSEMKPTKSATGEYLQLDMQVVQGEYEGRYVFDRLNLINQNSVAVDIAQKSLASICRAVGVLTPADSGELHDRPFQVKVSVRPGRDGYDPSNDVKAYRAVGGGNGGSAPAAPAASSASKDSTPPWKR
jgi:hypothetical protein